MGATSSSFVHEVKNPTRTLVTKLELHEKTLTFLFSQEMKKGVGEDQTLTTRVYYTGTMRPQNSDVWDELTQHYIPGNPRYLLDTDKVRFLVEWGDEWYQKKSGSLTREAQPGNKAKKTFTPITNLMTTTNTPPATISIPLQPIVPPLLPTATSTSTPSAASSSTTPSSSSSSSSPSPSQTVSLPPPVPALPRGYSHSAPLSPAPMGLDRQRSYRETEEGQRPTTIVQTMASTNTDKNRPTTATSTVSATPTTSTRGSVSAPVSASVTPPPVPRRIQITYNGLHHDALQKASSLEEMSDLLQLDDNDWTGTFSSSALAIQLEVLSEEIRVNFFKPKFEYLWAQVQNDCPIIMALSNVYQDHAPNELYIKKVQEKTKKTSKGKKTKLF